MELKAAYDLFFVVGAAAVCGGEGGGALLQVPRFTAVLRRTADGQGIDTVGVSITVTAVKGTASITRGPHKDVTLPASTLQKVNTNIHLNNSATCTILNVYE